MTSLRKSLTVTGLAYSALLSMAVVSFSSEPAGAVVYCTVSGYPAGCVARAGVVLRPRPVARAAVAPTRQAQPTSTAASIGSGLRVR